MLFKITFLENYSTQTFRVELWDYELLILINTANIRPYHGKMVTPIINNGKMVSVF